jgi:hypothetical protein
LALERLLDGLQSEDDRIALGAVGLVLRHEAELKRTNRRAGKVCMESNLLLEYRLPDGRLDADRLREDLKADAERRHRFLEEDCMPLALTATGQSS